MTTLSEIDSTTKLYSVARGVLADRVSELTDGLERLKREHLASIKRAVVSVRAIEERLRAQIKESPELFVKPRTQILYGIKIGFRKANGKIEIDDEEQVVKLIRKHFEEQFDVLVKTTERPVKKALEQLTAAELKKLGITVEETGDVVLVKDTASDVDKLVTALLKEDTEEVES